MKSKMNIRSIIIMSAILILSMLFINISLAANTGTINVETANLRETADAESKILEQLSLNQEVEIVEKAGDWYKVKHNNITGYIRKDLINTKEEKVENNEATQVANQVSQENTTTSNNVQSNAVLTENNSELGEYILVADTKLKLVPTINATDVVEVKKDEKVNATEIINDWVCVETKTTKGWIRKDKLQREQKVEQIQQPVQEEVVKTKTKYINATSVNVRKEPNTTSEIIVNATQNTAVTVSKEENGWSKVTLNGKEGYISSSLLSDTKQEPAKTNTTSRGANTSRKSSKKEKSTNAQVNVANDTKTPSNSTGSAKGSAIVATAKKYLGYKYVYGGTSPSTGFDCSGFTSYVYRQHGISLNRTAAGQYSNGTYVSRANLQPGDLVMFGSPINHVAIYIGGGQIIHASTPSTGVRIDSLNSGYYSKNYTGARRIVN
mgnify:FL=1